MLLFVPGLVQAMPQPVLAAVVIAASISLFDVAELRRLFRVRRTEFALAVACALGVMFVGVLQGIVIAVVAVDGLHLQARLGPLLGRARDGPGAPRLARHPALSGRRAGAGPAHRPLVGAAVLRQREPVPRPDPGARARTRRRRRGGSSSPPSRSPTSTRPPARCSLDLDLELNAAGIHLAFAELQSDVRDTIVRYGLLETIDQGHLYRSVTEAVEAFRREAGDVRRQRARPPYHPRPRAAQARRGPATPRPRSGSARALLADLARRGSTSAEDARAPAWWSTRP